MTTKSASTKGKPTHAGTSHKGFPAGKKSGKNTKMSTKHGFNQKRMDQAVKKVFGLSKSEDMGNK